MKILLTWLLITAVQAVPHSKLTITFNKSFGGGLLAADLNSEINKLEVLDTDNKINITTLSSGELISGTRVNKFFTDLENAIEAIGKPNYFGDGSDGDVTITGTTSLPVAKASGYNYGGSYDGDMVVKNYNNLTIDAGATLTTASPTRGLLIYVKGNLVVNGTISMTARGAYTPSINSEVNSQGLIFQRFTSSGTDATPTVDSGSTIRGAGNAAENSEANQKNINGLGTIFKIAKVGGAGGAGINSSGHGHNTGRSGASGASVRSSGGGGSGGSAYGDGLNSSSRRGGNGSSGTCFSGGSGGGGSTTYHGVGGHATSYGGRGGNGTSDGGNRSSGGGAGNPGMSGGNGGPTGSSGTGGLIVLIVKGDITIGSNGSIESKGSSGGNSNVGAGHHRGGGGSSGGGSILILRGGNGTDISTLTSKINVNGAPSKTGSGTRNFHGGAGGLGSVQVYQILD